MWGGVTSDWMRERGKGTRVLSQEVGDSGYGYLELKLWDTGWAQLPSLNSESVPGGPRDSNGIAGVGNQRRVSIEARWGTMGLGQRVEVQGGAPVPKVHLAIVTAHLFAFPPRRGHPPGPRLWLPL